MVGLEQLLKSAVDFQEYFQTETRSNVEKGVFRYTDCGASIKIFPDRVIVGTVVEGTNAEFTTNPLYFPFAINDFFARLQECEDFAQEICGETIDISGDLRYAGGRP